eukprot:TRINITY_DN54801_c0_g1_i2.p1 TRINITY_DN54801_c0_g1~~TRINITY_DN54801_c0_g1_i2.p1  ORF type:complete len:303 (-),score=4.02 TRINITY_DN54801_c0_g1_i2:98-940(-)
MGAPPSAAPLTSEEAVAAAVASGAKWVEGPRSSQGYCLAAGGHLGLDALPAGLACQGSPSQPSMLTERIFPIRAEDVDSLHWTSEIDRVDEDIIIPAQRKRPACLEPSTDPEVAVLLPLMKRMRLRPSLGQLRLQREADDAAAQMMPPHARLFVQPVQLRAFVSIDSSIVAWPGDCSSQDIQLELSFPPQYPHQPPRVFQVAPEAQFSGWRYGTDGALVLECLTARHWSPAKGVADIVQDLLQGLAGEPPTSPSRPRAGADTWPSVEALSSCPSEDVSMS